ncbi:MAG: M48 family metalloprotease [Selenomonas sp.]|nr:M48 family metalloprotease [Selenomonas sp.]
MVRVRNFIAAFCLAVTLFSANMAAAYTISDSAEHFYGAILNDEYESSYHAWDNPFLQGIQAELVKYNPDLLNFNDGRHSRYLPPVKESAAAGIDATTLPAGQIYITTQMINFALTIPPSGNIELRNRGAANEENFYQRAMLGAVLAHECAHWYNRDFQRKIDTLYGDAGLQQLLGKNYQQPSADNILAIMTDIAYNKTAANARFSVASEYLADKQAVEFLNNSLMFSTGSLVSFLYRLKLNEDQVKFSGMETINMSEYNPHPDTAERIRRLEQQISDYSFGRVTFQNQKFYLDGKPFFGTGTLQGTNKVSSLDRTYYVAGQIAKSIHQGSWGNNKIAFAKVYESDDIHTADITDVYLIFADHQTKSFGVIDRLKLKPNESIYLLGETDRPSEALSYDAQLAYYISHY